MLKISLQGSGLTIFDPSHAARMLQMSFQVPILAIFGPRPPECSKWCSRCSFWPHLAPDRQNAQNDAPEIHFYHIWPRGARMLKMRLQKFILATFGPRPPECGKWNSRCSFWPHLAPGRQNHKEFSQASDEDCKKSRVTWRTPDMGCTSWERNILKKSRDLSRSLWKFWSNFVPGPRLESRDTLGNLDLIEVESTRQILNHFCKNESSDVNL